MNDYEKIQLMRQRCESMILAMVGVEGALKWWNSKNYAFDMKTPLEMIDLDPQRVYTYVIGHVDGYG